jgi:hypothetical protein
VQLGNWLVTRYSTQVLLPGYPNLADFYKCFNQNSIISIFSSEPQVNRSPKFEKWSDFRSETFGVCAMEGPFIQHHLPQDSLRIDQTIGARIWSNRKNAKSDLFLIDHIRAPIVWPILNETWCIWCWLKGPSIAQPPNVSDPKSDHFSIFDERFTCGFEVKNERFLLIHEFTVEQTI